MKIESIHIATFGCLQDFSCEFGTGLNIIEGNNESGKSTVAAFIRYMLYGFPGRSPAGELGEKQKRINWQEGRAAGQMVVSVGEKRYRIERSITAIGGARDRESYRETGKIIDLSDNSLVYSGRDAGQVFFGVPESVYLNTAFVGQVGSPRVEGGMDKAIENILFSGDENISAQKAVKKLDDLRRTLLYKNERGGLIYDLRQSAADLRNRFERAKLQNADILQNEAVLEDTARKLQDAKTALAAAVAKETFEKSIICATAFDHLHAAEAERDAAVEMLRDMEGMPAYLLHEQDITDLQVAENAAREGFNRSARAREERERLEREQAVAEERRRFLEVAEREGGPEAVSLRHRSARSRFVGGLVLLVFAVAVALACGGVALAYPALFDGSLVYAFGAACLVALILLGFGLPLALTGGRILGGMYAAYEAKGNAALAARLQEVIAVREALGVHRNDIANALAREADAYAEYNRLLGELDTVVSRFGSRLPHEDIFPFVDGLVADARRMMERKREYEATRVSSEEKIQVLTVNLSGVDEAEVRAALPDGPLPSVEELHPEERNRQTNFYRAQVAELQERHHELEKNLIEARSRVEDPARLGAELSEVEETLAAAEERYAACVMACDAIDGAGECLRRDVSPRLSDFSGRMMAMLTEGRYAALGVDPTLELSVEADAATRPIDCLSAGTQDLAYLSLRMALIELLYTEKPPVCFDESFMHQDNNRAARMVNVLLFLSRAGQQNIVFTCHTRERELAVAQGAEKEITCIQLA